MSIPYKNAAEKLRLSGLDPKVKETSSPKSILLFLAERANETGYCFPGVAYIADVLEMAEPTVRKWTAWLVKYEFIEKSKRGKGNGYQLLFAPMPPKRKIEDDDGDGLERYEGKTPLHYSDDNENTATLERSEGNSSLYYSSNDSEHRYIIEATPLYYVGALIYRLILTNKERESSQESIKPSGGSRLNFSEFCNAARFGLRKTLKVIHLPFTPARWEKAFKAAFENEFTAGEFLDCFREKSLDPHRKYPVTPENVAEALAHFRLRRSSPPVAPPRADGNQDFKASEPPPAISAEDWRPAELERLQTLLDAGYRSLVIEDISYLDIDDQDYFREKLGITEAA